jgi:hypothetical protein
MLAFSKFLKFPTCLKDVGSIKKEHVTQCLRAAKAPPQLDMKLGNMPVPLNADFVDEYMRFVLEAPWDGNL